MFIRLDKTRERNGRTDGQTDRSAMAITVVCIASNVAALQKDIDVIENVQRRLLR